MQDITFSINFKLGRKREERAEAADDAIQSEGLEKWLETAQQFVKTFRKKSH